MSDMIKRLLLLPMLPLAAHAGSPALTADDLKPLEDARKALVSTLGLTNAPSFDLELIAKSVNSLRLSPYAGNGWAEGLRLPSFSEVRLAPGDLSEIMDLAVKATDVFRRVSAREAAHRRQLAAKGIAEIPASKAACRFNLEAGGNSFLFDRWGELHIDRRFADSKDLAVIRRIEACYRRIFGGSAYSRSVPSSERKIVSRAEACKAWPLPIFRGFEDDRYQAHDALIIKLTADFNAHKAAWIGGTPGQAAKTPSLSPALVKAHMIEESGGNGPQSMAAWRVDPLQVNVPGDWDEAKTDLGLRKPVRRNEGDLAANVRAAIMFLSRKGFGTSGRAAKMRPAGFFDGWQDALRRYNARRDRTSDGRYYSEAYASKIMSRASHPDAFVPIEIRLAGKSSPRVAAPLSAVNDKRKAPAGK